MERKSAFLRLFGYWLVIGFTVQGRCATKGVKDSRGAEKDGGRENCGDAETDC